MTRNDTFYKILFAIEIALLPLVIAANLLLPMWTVSLFIVGILVAKIWMALFKDKENRVHSIINSIGGALEISTLVIFFTSESLIESVVLTVFVVIFVVLFNVFKVVLFNSKMPELIDAVDACFAIFEFLALVAFILISLVVVEFTSVVLNISMFALLLTSAVSVLYKLFYVFKTNDVWGKIRNFFARRK